MNDFLWPVIIVIIGSTIGHIVTPILKANKLKSGFAQLGTLSGKSKDEIIAIVGQPTAISMVSEQQILLQWIAGGYHIALLFTGNLCDGITHEMDVNPTSA